MSILTRKKNLTFSLKKTAKEVNEDVRLVLGEITRVQKALQVDYLPPSRNLRSGGFGTVVEVLVPIRVDLFRILVDVILCGHIGEFEWIWYAKLQSQMLAVSCLLAPGSPGSRKFSDPKAAAGLHPLAVSQSCHDPCRCVPPSFSGDHFV